MSFNGTGTYTLYVDNPLVVGELISASKINNTFADIATALSSCITKDGNQVVTANIPMNGYKITGLANPTNVGDALTFGSNATISSLSIGNAYTFPPTGGSYGQVLSTDGAGNVLWTSVSGGGGPLTSLEITNALGFTPYSNINPNGYISTQALSVAINSASGGGNLSYRNGIFSFTPAVTYSLPTASSIQLGGVKVDDNSITISNGIISSRLAAISNGNNIITTSNLAVSHYNGYISSSGDSVVREYILYATTTNAEETELLINWVDRIPVSANTAIFYSVDVIGRCTNAADSSAFYLKGVASNISGTTSDVGSLYEIIVARTNNNIVIDVRVNSSLNTLGVYVTGTISNTIKWVACVKTTEVSG